MAANSKQYLIHLIAICFAMLGLSNIKIEYVADFLPLFDVMIIYYFAILRPHFLPSWFLFIMGLFTDALNGFPLGMTAIFYILLAKVFCEINHKMAPLDGFGQILRQFFAFCMALMLLKWLFLSLFHLQFYNFWAPFLQIIISCTLYVLLHKFFHFLEVKLSIFDDAQRF
jgi:rod shape-determining protein MreD